MEGSVRDPLSGRVISPNLNVPQPHRSVSMGRKSIYSSNEEALKYRIASEILRFRFVYITIIIIGVWLVGKDANKCIFDGYNKKNNSRGDFD